MWSFPNSPGFLSWRVNLELSLSCWHTVHRFPLFSVSALFWPSALLSTAPALWALSQHLSLTHTHTHTLTSILLLPPFSQGAARNEEFSDPGRWHRPGRAHSMSFTSWSAFGFFSKKKNQNTPHLFTQTWFSHIFLICVRASATVGLRPCSTAVAWRTSPHCAPGVDPN